MGKSESTAVNELISLVQGGSPRRPDPSDDLFGSPKAKLPPPRMTSTIPPVRGAGEVAPLPPQRAPIGTSQLNVNNGKPVRMVTAPPTRATTIPPLPQPRASASKLPPLPVSTRPSQPPPPTPQARATLPQPAQTLPEPPTAPVRPQGTLPPLPRATAPQAAQLPPPTQAKAKKRTTGPQRTTPPATAPVAAPWDANPLAQPTTRPAIDRPGDDVSADNWFEASRMVEKIEETFVGTAPAPKREASGETIKKILLPLVVLTVVSGGVAYLVFSHHAKKIAPPVTHVAAPKQAAPSPVATTPSTESANAATASAGGTQPEPPAPGSAPAAVASGDEQIAAHPNANEVKIVSKGSSDSAPAAAPVAAPAAAPAAPVPAEKVAAIAETKPTVEEVPTANGVIKLVDVRIDSKPAGATVMLVDNGKTSFLGTTPVAASVDPSRSYDVVLTLEGRPTQIAHLDPNKAQKLEITLSKTGAKTETPKASPVKSEAPARAPARKHVAKSAPTGGIVDPGFDAPAETKAEAKGNGGGEGTLMVSSKPPCEIFVDGNDTGKMTPQRALSLPAGAHKITFSNTDENITKTVTVKIEAGQSTKLIQNLMQ